MTTSGTSRRAVWRRASLVLASTLLLAACGSSSKSGSGPQTPTTAASAPENDAIAAERAAVQAAGDPGFLSTIVPQHMTAQKTYQVRAFLASGKVIVRISTTTTPTEIVTKIPTSTVMSVVLNGDHFKISATDGDNTKVDEQQRLDVLQTQQEEWDWNVVPERTGFAPLNNSEQLHLFFHVWFFKYDHDSIGVEVTPPRERDLVVEINPEHSFGRAVAIAWGIAGVVGVSTIAAGVHYVFKRRRPKATKKK